MRALRALALAGVLLTGVAATPAPASTVRPPAPAASAAPAPASTPSAVPTTAPNRIGAAQPAAATPALAAYRAFFNWYDLASPGMSIDNIHLVNSTGGAPVTGTVRLGTASLSFSLAPGAETFTSFPAGTIGGPVFIEASAPLLATQRVTYNRSFSEIAALPATAAAVEGWWPWYDLASPGMIGDNIHVVNPDPSVAAAFTVRAGGASVSATLQPLTGTWVNLPVGTIGGPVHLTSDHAVLASQRVQTRTSFNEIAALGTADAGTVLYSNWYDLASPGFSADNLHVVNTSATPANVTVLMNGSSVGTFSIAGQGERHLSFPVGTIGGPIRLNSDQPVVATQRVNYYDAFQEVAFHPVAAAVTSAWYTWYDDASPCFIGDNVHVTNPGSAVVTGQARLPGQPVQAFTLQPGQEQIVSWPRGTIGGPLQVTASGTGVVIDQRVVICPPPPPPPPPITPRRIVVSISQEHLWAYDNGNLLLDTDITTGRPELPTPTGTFHIFNRQAPYQMISPWPYGSPFWYASAWVNWAMEFIPGGYFLHDAPWRSWFGPGSQYGDGTHGCVNIPNDAMLQIWNWAQLGDEVDVVS